MAIKIKKGESYLYRGNEGVLSMPNKLRADHIYEDAVKELKDAGEKGKDSLELWYKRGVVAKKLLEKYKIDHEERKFFWTMLYDAAGLKIPKKSYTVKNDFLTASILVQHKLSDLRKVGSWSLWREIIGSTRIINDERVAEWVAKQVIENNVSRDNARPLLKHIRNRLKNLDTTVLSNEELNSKLNSVDWQR